MTSQERVNIPDIYWFQLFYYIKRKRKRMKIRDSVRVIEKAKFNFRHCGKYKLCMCRVYL